MNVNCKNHKVPLSFDELARCMEEVDDMNCPVCGSTLSPTKRVCENYGEDFPKLSIKKEEDKKEQKTP
ncbi:hypothetical protein M1506_02445 [Patescibacteria group bacterium]|nr:hypothetical protein [Patescibacteria group bacterium]